VTDLALDSKTGRLYAATDFNVLVQKGKSGKWQLAAGGMPMVEVSGLTLDSKNRVLYAATHGRAIWSLQLQNDGSDNGGGNGSGAGGNGNGGNSGSGSTVSTGSGNTGKGNTGKGKKK
jgi:hypothetical protein